jgi:plasmid maintenance system antidote protein VapI
MPHTFTGTVRSIRSGVELPAAPEIAPRVDGAALRAAREEHGLTLRQLAAMIELSPGFVSRLENGRRPMTPAIAQRLAQTVAW